MSYEIVVADSASDDVQDICTHFINVLKAPEAGLALLQRIKNGIDSLVELPMRHTIADPILAAVGFRTLLIDDYMVFYVVSDTTVNIIRVLHSSRDWVNILYDAKNSL